MNNLSTSIKLPCTSPHDRHFTGDGRIQEDSGWDVFALQYRVDGPLGTLFPAACAARYRLLFTQLWRVKRLEHALHDAWRRHAILNKRLKYMPGGWSCVVIA